MNRIEAIGLFFRLLIVIFFASMGGYTACWIEDVIRTSYEKKKKKREEEYEQTVILNKMCALNAITPIILVKYTCCKCKQELLCTQTPIYWSCSENGFVCRTCSGLKIEVN